jgi:hypothetical protein
LRSQLALAGNAFGLFVTLHDEGERPNTAATALGPFDEIAIRSARVVGERAHLGMVIAAHGTNGRWRGADPELQRALEADGGDATRSHIRVHTEGVELFIRLYDDEPEHTLAIAELGPFSVVDAGTYELRADALIVAVRVSSMGPWLLTNSAGADLEGVSKKVLGLRASAAAPGRVIQPPVFHEPIQPTRPTRPVEAPAPVVDSTPSVWVDRVRPAPEIYISRPDVPRKG